LAIWPYLSFDGLTEPSGSGPATRRWQGRNGQLVASVTTSSEPSAQPSSASVFLRT
jgi:hypothetical protein